MGKKLLKRKGKYTQQSDDHEEKEEDDSVYEEEKKKYIRQVELVIAVVICSITLLFLWDAYHTPTTPHFSPSNTFVSTPKKKNSIPSPLKNLACHVEGHVCTAFRHFTFVDFILKSQQENEWIQGKKLTSKGDFARAEQCFRIWIQKKDVDPEGYLGLAYCLAQQRKLPDAIELLEKAVSLAPYERVYFNNLGTLYAENGNLIKAMEMYQRALELSVENARDAVGIYTNLKNVANALGDSLSAQIYGINMDIITNNLDIAKQMLVGILDKHPTNYLALKSLALCFIRKGFESKGLQLFERAIALQPNDKLAYLELAIALNSGGNLANSESIRALRTALQIDPNFVPALEYLAYQLFYIGGKLRNSDKYQLDEAIELYSRAIAIQPTNRKALKGLLEASISNSDWKLRDSVLNVTIPMLQEQVYYLLSAVPRPLEELIITMGTAMTIEEKFFSENSLLAIAKATSSIIYHTSNQQLHFPHSPRKHRDGRIRIGYLSNFFGHHPTGYLLHESFRFHNKLKFNIFCYSTSDDSSHQINTTKLGCEHYRYLGLGLGFHNSNADSIANAIYSDQIDILVEFEGLLDGTQAGSLIKRPAPIQIHSLGLPHSTGAPFFDYFVADEVVVPKESRELFTEKIIYMPHSYQLNSFRNSVYDLDKINRVEKTTASDFGLPDDKIIFANFNSIAKLNPFIFGVWMKIMKRVPNSVLWILHPHNPNKLLQHAESMGISQDRIIIGEYIRNFTRHLQRIQHAHLQLDGAPWGSHTTAADSLWAGLPILTMLNGRRMTSRVASSLLTAMNVTELIARDWDEYENLAVRLATDNNFYNETKKKIIANRMHSPAFDTQLWIQNFEKALETVWSIYQQQQPPRDIRVRDFL